MFGTSESSSNTWLVG
ncbi:unnamed protein product, partial [Didymodactylos carnosus]